MTEFQSSRGHFGRLEPGRATLDEMQTIVKTIDEKVTKKLGNNSGQAWGDAKDMTPTGFVEHIHRSRWGTIGSK
jgi:hypothetical protein